MLDLKVDKVFVDADQIGIVRMFSHKSIPDGWLVLTDDTEYDPVRYALLFEKLGYRFGRGIINSNNFRLPSINRVRNGRSTRAVFIQPFNHNNRGNRNRNRLLGSTVPGKFRAHRHSVSVGSGGRHSHSMSGTWYGPPPGHNAPDPDGSIPRSFSHTAMPASHGYHSHGGSSGSVAPSTTARIESELRPVSMTAVACIYSGVTLND